MPTDILRFSDFHIRPSTREVFGSGGLAELEPRAFDLLAYLVEHRNRVVGKDELLEQVWKTTFISESVLARAVMKLRKGLADVGVDPECIKTVHRVGYRFLGSEPEAVGTEPVAATPDRFALLPFINDTGDPMLVWVELGLNALVARRIADESSATPIPIESILHLLETVPGDATLEDRVVAVKQAFGEATVIHARLSSTATGTYLLTWNAWPSSSVQRSGTLEGPQPASLGMALGATLRALIAPDSAAATFRPMSTEEEFINAAHARALHALASHEPTQALLLIRVCLDIEPHPLQVDVDHIQILTLLDAAKAETHGMELLARLDVATHPKERLTLLCALAQSSLAARDWNRCDQRCQELEEILALHPDEYKRAWNWSMRFEIALERGELDTARSIFAQGIERARNRNDRVDAAAWLSDIAKLELAKGDWDRGRELINESLDMARSERRQPFSFMATPLNNLAITLIWRGMVPEAIALLAEALPIARTYKNALVLAATFANMYLGNAEAGDTDAALAALHEAVPFIERSGSMLLAYGGFLVDQEIRFGSLEKAHQDSIDALSALTAVAGTHRSFGLYINGLIAFGALEEAEVHLLKNAPDYEAASGSLAHANYLHACAHLAYAHNEADRDLMYLDQYLKARGSMVASFQGTTDVLWMHLDVDDLAGADAIALEIPNHLANTVRGRLCAARLAFAHDDRESAITLQKEVVGRSAGRRSLPYMQELLEHYQSPTRSAKRSRIPAAPLMPSLL